MSEPYGCTGDWCSTYPFCTHVPKRAEATPDLEPCSRPGCQQEAIDDGLCARHCEPGSWKDFGAALPVR